MGIITTPGMPHFEKQAAQARSVSKLWGPRPASRNDIDVGVKTRICSLYKQGYSLRELADWFRTSHETIRAILKEAGILRRRRGNAPALGTERVMSGYRQVFVGSVFPGAPKSGWIYKHRLVMQEHLGRPLKKWEVVHHIDRNKLNNEVPNLKVMSPKDHPTCVACPYFEFYQEQTGNKIIKA